MSIALFELLRREHAPAEARQLLATGKVRLRGVPTADGGRLVEPAEVQVDPRAPRCVPGRDLAVVWRDAHYALVWKPPGLLSVPARGEDNAMARVGRLFGAAYAVHRLDEGTSGLLLVALREAAVQPMKALFERHEIERRYLALVSGHAPEGPLRIHTHLIRDRGDGLRGSLERLPPDAVPPRERVEAITTLRRLERLRGASLVEASLETGRTHQVRIHCAELGLPILGDPLYAPRRVQGAAPRLALHAAILGFRHPLSGQALRFEAPLADDLERLRRGLSDAPATADKGPDRAPAPAGREARARVRARDLD